MKKILIQKRPNIESVNKDFYIESNPHLAGFTKAIKEVYEDAWLIHVIRDPRDYYTSLRNFGSDRGLKKFLRIAIPYWESQTNKQIYNTRIKKFSKIWYDKNVILNQAKEMYKKDYLCVRYEDLFDVTRSGIKEILQFLNLELKDKQIHLMTKEKINRSKTERVQNWINWDSESAQDLHRICGSLMLEYGYGLEPEWLEKIG